MLIGTTIYTQDNADGSTSLIYDRKAICGWKVEVMNMENEDTLIGVFRTTMRDGIECEQFTMLPTKHSDDTILQIRIYKNGNVLVYGRIPVNTVVLKRKKIITVQFMCHLEISSTGEIIYQFSEYN